MTDSPLHHGWTSDQREIVQDFCMRACRSLYVVENRGDLPEDLNRMLAAGLVHLVAVNDEQLGELLDIDQDKPTLRSDA